LRQVNFLLKGNRLHNSPKKKAILATVTISLDCVIQWKSEP